MKSYIYSAIVIILAIASVSCSKETTENNFVSMDQVLTLTKSFSTEIVTKAGTVKPATLRLEATYSIPQDEVLSFEITSDNDDVDVYYIDEELRNALEREFGDKYTNLGEIEAILSSGTSPESEGLGDCIRGCNSNFTKGNGRGACRFECWGNYLFGWAIRFLDSLSAKATD